MKRVLILAAIALLSAAILTAQTNETSKTDEGPKTLLGGSKIKHSGYIGLDFKAAQIDGKLGFLLGGKAGWLMNRTFTIGVAGYGNVPMREYNYKNLLDSSLTGDRMFGYGGLFFEYILNPMEVIHFTGNVLIGAGGSTFSRNNGNFGNDLNRSMMSDSNDHPTGAYLIVEPTVSVEMNVTRFMKVGIAASYRYASLIYSNNLYDKNANIKDMSLSGLSGNLYFNFGWF